MRRITFSTRVSCLFLLLAVLQTASMTAVRAEGEGPPVLADEAARYKKSFSWLGAFPGAPDLHDARHQTFLDGARGEVQFKPTPRRVAPVFPPGVANFTDYKFWQTGCRAALIAVATSIDSTPFLAFAKQHILTRNRFRLEEVTKAPAGVSVGSVVSVVRPGGELIDQGELLRMIAQGVGGPYIVGQRYLLLGFQPPSLQADEFAYASPTIHVVGHVAFVEAGVDSYDSYEPAFEVERYLRAIRAWSAAVPCR